MKKTLCLILAALLMLSLCACGESSSQAARSEAKAANGYAMADEAYYMEEPAYEPAPAYESEEAYGLSAAQNTSAPGGANDAPSQRPGKIIYSSNVRVETTDFDGTLSKLDQPVNEYGGWVEFSSINGTNYAERSRGAVSRRSARQ